MLIPCCSGPIRAPFSSVNRLSVEVRIQCLRSDGQLQRMNWQTIRLELGRTREFPNGSASRAYLLRAPLNAEGEIDEQALLALPEQATVRRLWPSEPDVSGHLTRIGDKWAFVGGRNGAERKVISEIEALRISEGAMLMLRERGQELPFRVAKMRNLG